MLQAPCGHFGLARVWTSGSQKLESGFKKSERNFCLQERLLIHRSSVARHTRDQDGLNRRSNERNGLVGLNKALHTCNRIESIHVASFVPVKSNEGEYDIRTPQADVRFGTSVDRKTPVLRLLPPRCAAYFQPCSEIPL